MKRNIRRVIAAAGCKRAQLAAGKIGGDARLPQAHRRDRNELPGNGPVYF
jgi:hypothetical protein